MTTEVVLLQPRLCKCCGKVKKQLDFYKKHGRCITCYRESADAAKIKNAPARSLLRGQTTAKHQRKADKRDGAVRIAFFDEMDGLYE